METEPYYTIQEVAAILSVCVETVRRMVARGEIEANKIGKSLRISPAELALYLERSKVRRKRGKRRKFERLGMSKGHAEAIAFFAEKYKSKKRRKNGAIS